MFSLHYIQVASLLNLWSSFKSARYLNENKRYKTANTNSIVNVKNHTALFVSITWQQKDPWVEFYTHMVKLVTYTTNVYIAGACIEIVTKTFGILQSGVKGQKMLISPYI